MCCSSAGAVQLPDRAVGLVVAGAAGAAVHEKDGDSLAVGAASGASNLRGEAG